MGFGWGGATLRDSSAIEPHARQVGATIITSAAPPLTTQQRHPVARKPPTDLSAWKALREALSLCQSEDANFRSSWLGWGGSGQVV